MDRWELCGGSARKHGGRAPFGVRRLETRTRGDDARHDQRHRAVVGEGEFAHQIAALAGHVAEIVGRVLQPEVRPLYGFFGIARSERQASKKH